MFGTHDLLLFIFAGWLLNVTPGPDTALIVARSTQMGVRGGFTACAGIALGIMAHISAAAIGLSAIIAASATAFGIIKFVGAGYLIYIGVRIMLTRPAIEPGDTAQQPRIALPLRAVFWQGFWSNALNPKVAIFFLAFLPQFVNVDAPSKALAFFFLGLVFNVNGTLWNLIVAYVVARASSALRGTKRVQRWIDGAIGAMFVALGVKLALYQR